MSFFPFPETSNMDMTKKLLYPDDIIKCVCVGDIEPENGLGYYDYPLERCSLCKALICHFCCMHFGIWMDKDNDIFWCNECWDKM